MRTSPSCAAVGDAEAAGGRKLVFVLRTPENEQSFYVLFAMVKFGELVANGNGPIKLYLLDTAVGLNVRRMENESGSRLL